MKLSDLFTDTVKKWLRILLQIGIFGTLIYQLADIGFKDILQSLPLNPFFYLIFLVIYFSLPISEIFIYKLKWPLTWRSAFPVFIQKKVLNTDVVGYSGEFFLFHWARNTLGINGKDAAKYVKDNNILSSVASTFITIILVYYFVMSGYISITDYIEFDDFSFTTILGVVIGVVVISFLAFHFRKQIISINKKEAIQLFGVHAFRILFINIFQIIQYSIARPDIPMEVWFTITAIQIGISRIPGLPSTDALFVTIALQMSGSLDVPSEILGGITGINLLLKRILNIVTFSLANLFKTEIEEGSLEDEKAEFSEEVNS